MIHNIIITHPSGLPLFGRSLMCHIGMDCIDLAKDNTFADETLLNSALLNAMLIFDSANPNQFHEFALEKTKTLTFPTEDLTVILYTDPEDNLEEYKNRLRLFAELFSSNYGQYLTDFDGNINRFEPFQEIIANEGLLEEGERFRKNCVECEYDKACAYRISIGSLERTFKQRIDEIIPISFFKKMKLILVGMFKPRYILLNL